MDPSFVKTLKDKTLRNTARNVANELCQDNKTYMYTNELVDKILKILKQELIEQAAKKQQKHLLKDTQPPSLKTT